MAKPVKIRAKLKGEVASIKSLMPHPMETGARKDPEGNLVAAHYLETVTRYRKTRISPLRYSRPRPVIPSR